jgi:hypothetical protein
VEIGPPVTSHRRRPRKIPAPHRDGRLPLGESPVGRSCEDMRRIANPFEHYLDRIDQNGCWITWLAPNSSGYGAVWTYPENSPRRKVGLHVASYLHFIGPIPAGLVLDHVVCQERLCFNPQHLEPVLVIENVRRACEKIRNGPFKCGHPRTSDNVMRNGLNRSGNPSYRCKICDLARHASRTRRERGLT